MATKTGSKATKKRTPKGRTRSAPPPPAPNPLRVLLRADVAGILLILAAIFTLLSLLASSRGYFTDSWVWFLRSLFGVGVWVVPFMAGGLGLWLVMRALENHQTMAWQRPVGFVLLFLALITTLSLLLPPSLRSGLAGQGDAGGQVGLALANAFEQTLGSWGAWALVTFLIIAAVVFLGDRLLVDGWFALQDQLGKRTTHSPVDPIPPAIQSPVPLPAGHIPWWKQSALWRQLFPPQPAPADTSSAPFAPAPASNLVRPAPVTQTPPAGTRPAPPPSSASAPPPLPARTVTPPAAGEDVITPRIVGASQEWKLPPLAAVLNDWERVTDSDELIRQQGRLIQETLALFGVPAEFEGAYKGPSVTQYLIKPGYVERKVGNENQRVKVKVAKIAALANDLALALAASSVRIEAPIPGTNYVGVEVPNQASNVVGLKELMESESFVNMKGKLRLALGEDVKGQVVNADMTRMPHLLIAGATGSGKSVCINSIIACLLLTQTPDNLRLLMVDPKMVELSVYNGIPHLLSPVVTEVDKAAAVLYWAVKEMERRYTLFNKANARDLPRYNAHLQKNGEKPLPYIVVIVDEMADLMMAAPEEVEKHVCRLAQMARAVGIHLIIATQRPSVDVITGLIKANFPARIAFAVTSQIDSRVVLDVPGAERLLGRGDMLFMAPDASKLERIQGTFLSDDEISKLVRYWRGIRSYEGSQFSVELGPPDPELNSFASPEKTTSAASAPSPLQPLPPPARPGGPLTQPPLFEQIEQMKAVDARDELYDEAVKIAQEHGRCSNDLLRRRLRVGYSRAARLMDQLAAAGVIDPAANKPAEQPPQTAPQPPQQPPPQAGQMPPPAPLPPRIIGSDPEADGPTPRIWM